MAKDNGSSNAWVAGLGAGLLSGIMLGAMGVGKLVSASESDVTVNSFIQEQGQRVIVHQLAGGGRFIFETDQQEVPAGVQNAIARAASNPARGLGFDFANVAEMKIEGEQVTCTFSDGTTISMPVNAAPQGEAQQACARILAL
ncbi:MAG: hypothetical protein GC136_10255 [Alphaproteobacteria bacterium]|nr:hypothetical protein [Alphaproteobacteria bacterium]